MIAKPILYKQREKQKCKIFNLNGWNSHPEKKKAITIPKLGIQKLKVATLSASDARVARNSCEIFSGYQC
ncbi:hypothetical protein WA1_41875 [Scytonema hofmannii PCC 7110]|uniref:Uncharacterized protein n=1 Tax=Scytonema hofmannii PCC 7110 TaxID=128403 RepID=A0A139WV11_9CYAN|nr:hypothetical protein WA1_41875 [Scytonema hofmannii PCC 7110]